MLKVGAGMAALDLPLSEYPAHSQFRVCEEQYDPCFCRAIAIETVSKKLLIMAYDLSDIPEIDGLEEKLAEAVGIDPDDVVITVTHNHSSPCDRGSRMASEEERQSFRSRFLKIELAASLEAAKQANASLRPAKYGYGEINSYTADNEAVRRPRIGYVRDENGNGYIDRTLAIIKFVDLAGRPICVFMNHPCHATFAMEPAASGKYATSGNFTGIASRFVEDYYGNGTVALWTSGAAGNLHPAMSEMVKPYTDGYTARVHLAPGTEFELMEIVGRMHGVDAVNCIESISEYSEDMVIAHTKGSILLENQKNLSGHGPFPKPVDYGPGVRSNQPAPAVPAAAPEIADDPEHPSTLQMEVLTLGDIALVGLGCELFCQIGRDIKNAIPAKHTVVVTHTPGYVGDDPHAVGYIVDKSSANSAIQKCYRNLKPGAYDEQITAEALRLYNEAVKKSDE